MRTVPALFFCIAAVGAAYAQAPEPVIFVHGNGDDATKWIPVIWLFESNGYPADRLFAIRFTDPSARRLDNQPEPFRSSTTDQASELSGLVARVLLETKAKKVVLIGSSRGGMTIRNYLKNAGGAAVVSKAILAGTPNHGVMKMAENPEQEFNGLGTFLTSLNQDTETVPGVRFMTLRSDKLDKYAQPNVGYDGPELKGAENVVLPNLDHRELAFQPSAFAQMFRFITGGMPKVLQPAAMDPAKISGSVTGFGNGAPTNRPLAGVRFRVFALRAGSATREGEALLDLQTDATGAWGPLTVAPAREYEFVLEKNSHVVTYFMTGLVRSTTLLNFRFPPAETGAARPEVTVHRPQGYFSQGRDVLTVDGAEVKSMAAGVPTSDSVRIPVTGEGGVRIQLRGETLYVRPALRANDTSIAELIWD